ncbi:hypothetical protein ES703_116836 [subsurface metagenome]
MAIIRFGPMVADARGSVGGTVFARNSAGAYTRNRTKPIYGGIGVQATRAAQMSQVVQTWQMDLSVDQRNAWTAKAPSNGLTNRVGDRMTGSGFNLYARANLLLLIADLAMVVAPPTPLTIEAPVFTIAWLDGEGIQVTDVHGWTATDTDHLIIQSANLLRDSINFHKGPWDALRATPGDLIRAVPTSIMPDFFLQSDTRSFFRFRVLNELGAISQAWIQHADIGTISP